MQDRFQIKAPDELIGSLETAGLKETLHDFDNQLHTKHDLVYNIKNGEVVFITDNKIVC